MPPAARRAWLMVAAAEVSGLRPAAVLSHVLVRPHLMTVPATLEGIAIRGLRCSGGSWTAVRGGRGFGWYACCDCGVENGFAVS